ncbi:MAG: penicillin-binding protein 2 [Blastocatellia bacterium]
MKSAREPGFDPAEDLRQAGMRLEIIRYLAIIIFVLIVGRLWFLQVMNSAVYAERAEQNRTRVLPIPARRGTIFDRKGRILVTSQSSYNIVLSRRDVKERDFPQIADLLVKNLNIDQDWLNKRFEAARYEAKYEFIVVKEVVTAADIAWVRAHQFEYPMIRYEEAPRRQYPLNMIAAHVLGYVGEVGRKELNDPKSSFSREKGYKLGDIIGQAGIERTHNDILAGKDGERRVVVDSRGRIQREIDRAEPIAGRDFYSTLDLDIQKVAELQTETMPAKRGAIVVMDPNNGEILAMVSRPSFDPNVFSLRAKTDQGKEEIRDLYEDPDKPLFNRVIQGTFPPGSTWKLLTTVAALNEGVITPTNSRIQDGDIQLGDRVMHSMSHDGMPEINRAILHSCDGYFYRLGLKMGPDKFERWVENFKFGHRTGIDLPHERPGTPPTRATKETIVRAELKRRKADREGVGVKEVEWTDKDEELVQKEARWKDYDMAASAFGQGMNASTPIQLLRYVGGLANGGFMNTPHLFLRAVAGVDREGHQQPELKYEDRARFIVPMNAEIHEIVKKGMWGAVHDGAGTAGGARVEGFDVCGKTGTAQVASKDKAGSKNKDHAWFISFAPREKPEICSVVLTENAGFGGKQSAPRAKEIYEDYYRRTRDLVNKTKADETKAEEVKKQ